MDCISEETLQDLKLVTDELAKTAKTPAQETLARRLQELALDFNLLDRQPDTAQSVEFTGAFRTALDELLHCATVEWRRRARYEGSAEEYHSWVHSG